jgi:hypothetical protein
VRRTYKHIAAKTAINGLMIIMTFASPTAKQRIMLMMPDLQADIKLASVSSASALI